MTDPVKHWQGKQAFFIWYAALLVAGGIALFIVSKRLFGVRLGSSLAAGLFMGISTAVYSVVVERRHRLVVIRRFLLVTVLAMALWWVTGVRFLRG